jgi:hypothetical protein
VAVPKGHSRVLRPTDSACFCNASAIEWVAFAMFFATSRCASSVFCASRVCVRGAGALQDARGSGQ